VKGSGRGLFQGIIPEFAWRDFGVSQNSSGAVVGVRGQDSNLAFARRKSDALPTRPALPLRYENRINMDLWN
jgi:hypothetical protein